MTLPTSGPLSIGDIKGEFGGNTSPSLLDYYAGGSFVPSGTSGTNGLVPSSGALAISNFYGTSKFIPHQQIVTSSQTVTVPAGATSISSWVLVAGGGAGGQGKLNISTGDIWGGGGGGSGGYTTGGAIAVAGGQTISCTIGTGGSATLSQPGNPSSISGSVSGGTISGSATGGGSGGNAGTSVGGSGGTAGSPNGVAGSNGGRNTTGAGGNNGQGYGGGGTGGGTNGGGQTAGADGVFIINWS